MKTLADLLQENIELKNRIDAALYFCLMHPNLNWSKTISASLLDCEKSEVPEKLKAHITCHLNENLQDLSHD